MTNMIDKIKRELVKKFNESIDELTCSIIMKKSNDVLIIEAQDSELDDETEFLIIGYKIFKIRVTGITKLAETIRDYDNITASRQDKMAELYAFDQDYIQTGRATQLERETYAREYKEIFGYNPFAA